MTESKIKNIVGAEELSTTLLNNFTIESWGFIKAYKIGGICLVTFSGLSRTTSAHNDTPFLEIPGITIKYPSMTTAGNGSTEQIMVAAFENDNKVLVNSLEANVYYFGQIVIAI